METALTILIWVLIVSIGLPIAVWLLIFLIGLIAIIFKD